MSKIAFFSPTVLVSSFASAVYFLLLTSQIGQPTNPQVVRLHHYSTSGLSYLGSASGLSSCSQIRWIATANGTSHLKMIVIYSIFLLSIYSSLSFIACALSTVQRHAVWIKRPTAIFANPINSEGSKYRGDITEEEAFLWFDEAMVSRRMMIERLSIQNQLNSLIRSQTVYNLSACSFVKKYYPRLIISFGPFCHFGPRLTLMSFYCISSQMRHF